jgi:hypothetical protein
MRKSATESRKHNPGILSTLGAVAAGTALAVGTKALQASVDAVGALARMADPPKKAGPQSTRASRATRTTRPTRKIAAPSRSHLRKRTAQG